MLALSIKSLNINIIASLVEVLVVLGVLKGFEVLAQRTSNYTSRYL
jgi:hypothetical protein